MRHGHLRDANNLKPIARDTVYEIGSLDFDRLYSQSDWGEKRKNECYAPTVTLSQRHCQLLVCNCYTNSKNPVKLTNIVRTSQAGGTSVYMYSRITASSTWGLEKDSDYRSKRMKMSDDSTRVWTRCQYLSKSYVLRKQELKVSIPVSQRWDVSYIYSRWSVLCYCTFIKRETVSTLSYRNGQDRPACSKQLIQNSGIQTRYMAPPSSNTAF